MSTLKIKSGGTWLNVAGAGVGVPSGGSAGQLLIKASATDYDMGWGSPPYAIYLTSVACSAMTGDFASVSDGRITADYVVAEITFANPSAITSDVTWTTVAGTLVLNGTCASATTCNVVLVPTT